jgi:hypothetical protein
MTTNSSTRNPSSASATRCVRAIRLLHVHLVVFCPIADTSSRFRPETANGFVNRILCGESWNIHWHFLLKRERWVCKRSIPPTGSRARGGRCGSTALGAFLLFLRTPSRSIPLQVRRLQGMMGQRVIPAPPRRHPRRVGRSRPHKSQILVPETGSYQQWPPGFSSLESQWPIAQA